MPISYTKELIALLEQRLQQQLPLDISWNCLHCSKRHERNVLENITAISVNNGDIALCGTEGNLISAIGISKNKKIQQNVADGYSKLGAFYIQVNPIGGIETPAFVTTCLNPRCDDCGGFQTDKNLVIIDCECWKCNGAMKIALIDADGYYPGPEEFTDDELSLARSKDVIIEEKFSRMADETYLANICPHCGILTGKHFLFTEYFQSAVNGYYPMESIAHGYHCETCYLDRDN